MRAIKWADEKDKAGRQANQEKTSDKPKQANKLRNEAERKERDVQRRIEARAASRIG